MALCPRSSFDWLGGGGQGMPLEQAPAAAIQGMDSSNATVQELAKITGTDWQLASQALEASGNDPQRCAPFLWLVGRPSRLPRIDACLLPSASVCVSRLVARDNVPPPRGKAFATRTPDPPRSLPTPGSPQRQSRV